MFFHELNEPVRRTHSIRGANKRNSIDENINQLVMKVETTDDKERRRKYGKVLPRGQKRAGKKRKKNTLFLSLTLLFSLRLLI
jgi:hypothetical protein